jgi:hypothetical protein
VCSEALAVEGVGRPFSAPAGALVDEVVLAGVVAEFRLQGCDDAADVVLGAAVHPGRADLVSITIDGIDALVNPVVRGRLGAV